MSRRHSPAVYRRRRFVVFGGLLLLLAGIGVGVWLLIAQPWQAAAAEGEGKMPVIVSPAPTDAPDPEPTDEPGATEDDAPVQEQSDAASDDPVTEGESEADSETDTDTETAVEPVAETDIGPCSARDIRVEAVTDATTYRSGALPQLSIRLSNNGKSDCTMNVGSTTQKFTITSGSDVWWRSTDCQSEPSDLIVTLAAGVTVTTAEPIEWNRTRSSPSTCDQDSRPRAPGNGASYHLAVEIGGVRATKTQQIFLY